MYLAKVYKKNDTHWVIRESVPTEDGFDSRDLFDLGRDPTEFIHYPGGNAFYFDERLEAAVSEATGQSMPDEMEDVLWPFVKPRIRRAVEVFRNREKALHARAHVQGKRDDPSIHETHTFDRRRIYYLRFGRGIQNRHLNRMPVALLGRVHQKSRDEIEQYFWRAESQLRLSEYKVYVFTVFDLQRHFRVFYASRIPQALDSETLDTRFLKDLCRLHDDAAFWKGSPCGRILSPYLARYALMFFDSDFPDADPMGDYVREFLRRNRAYRPLMPSTIVGLNEAAAMFGWNREQTLTISRRELTRTYRKLVMVHHPDQGGDPRAFIRLTDAYRSILAHIKTKRPLS